MIHKKIFLSLGILFLFSCHSTNQKTTDKFDLQKAEIIQMQKALLPDRRDAIFDLEIFPAGEQVVIKGKTDRADLKTALFSQLQAADIKFIDSLSLLPVEEFKNQMGICRLSVANLRAAPKHSAELVTQVLMGMPLQIYEKKNDFYRVKTPEGYYAWVDAAGMEIVTEEAFIDWLQKPKVIITSHCGKTYEKTSTNASVVSDFVLNDVFVWLYDDKDFSRVLYPDGRQAFISKKNLLSMTDFVKQTQQVTGNDIVRWARQYLGIPYLWGGTSTKGLDCSGFSKNVYAQAGYLLPRDASQQVQIGQPVQITDDFSYLQPGDLLFFGRKKDGKEKITHVAVHIENGTIIHATGEVKIESLNPSSPLYNDKRRKTLLQARRLLGKYPQTFVKQYGK